MFSLTSCDDKETEGVTGITYYPVLELEGETTLYLEKGDAFVEPGYKAILNGNDVTADVIVSDFNTDASGIFTINYTIFNEDGFSSSASRKAIVLDSNDPIEGFYAVTAESNRVYGGNTVEYGASFESLIINNGDGTYSMEDALAGWYSQRAGYGDKYNMSAVVAIDTDGALSLEDSFIAGWGDGLVSLDGSYDDATKTFTYVAVYVSGMTFNVTLSKK